MTTYGVTGATGHFGRNAINELAKLVPVTSIVALARNTEKAKQIVPSGVEVRPGDYTDVDQLEKSLKGIDRLLFVSSQPGGSVDRLTQHENVVKAAQKAEVSYIAYTSFPQAEDSTAALASDHQATEKLILETGIKHSFLRNNWYLENEAASIKSAINSKPFIYAAGDGKVGWALESEYSEAAAKVLASNDTKDIYEFAGPSRTYQDLATAIKSDFDVKSLSIEDYKDLLQKSGMDEGTISVVLAIQNLIRQGNLAEKSDDLQNVLGRELTPLDKALEIVGEK